MQPGDTEQATTENMSFQPPSVGADPGMLGLGTDAPMGDGLTTESLGAGSSLEGSSEGMADEITPVDPGSASSVPVETITEEAPAAADAAAEEPESTSDQGGLSALLGEDPSPAPEEE